MKTLIITLLLILSTKSFSQPYFAIGLQNKGANLALGTIVNKFDIQLNYKYPLSSAEEYKIISITIGKEINITNKDEDNYVLTPIIGAAWTTHQDFTQYDINPIYGPVSINKISSVYGTEIGKDSYMGRLAIVLRYCGKMYYGITMRVFFYR